MFEVDNKNINIQDFFFHYNTEESAAKHIMCMSF